MPGIMRIILEMLSGLATSRAMTSLAGRYLGKEAAMKVGEFVAKNAAGKVLQSGLTAAAKRAPSWAASRMPTAAGLAGGAVGIGQHLANWGAFAAGMEGASALMGPTNQDVEEWPQLAAMGTPEQARQQEFMESYAQSEALRQALESYLSPERGGGLQ
jgi:hypothetical protein